MKVVKGFRFVTADDLKSKHGKTQWKIGEWQHQDDNFSKTIQIGKRRKNRMGDATENFGIYLTLPLRWRKKLLAVAQTYVVGKQGKIQDAVRVAVAAMFFPEELEKQKQET